MITPEIADLLVKNKPKEYKKTQFNINKNIILNTFDYIQGTNKLDKKNNELEMRGYYYIFDKRTKKVKSYLSLKKYYYLNQIEDVEYNKINKKEIDTITIKEDGSLISFFVDNDSVFAKTRNGINSIPSNLANEILKKDKKLENSIKRMIIDNFNLSFEITSNYNIVVVPYSNTKLTLLQIRKANGIYLKDEEIKEIIKKYDFPIEYLVKREYQYNLDDLIKKSKIEENIEGWVVLFKDGTMIKIKTDWYIKSKETIYKNGTIKWSLIINKIIKDELEELNSQIPISYNDLIKTIQSKILKDFEDFKEKEEDKLKEILKITYMNNEKS